MTFCVCKHIQLKNLRSYKDASPKEFLFQYQSYVFTGLELCVRYDWWVIDQNTHPTSFRYEILCILALITQKVQVMYGRCTYQMTPLLSNTSSFCARGGCGIRMVSYGSKHTSRSLSAKPFDASERNWNKIWHHTQYISTCLFLLHMAVGLNYSWFLAVSWK